MEARFDFIMMVGGSGGMLPQEIRCSEIASGAIFGQKQSRSNYSSSNIWLFSITIMTVGGSGGISPRKFDVLRLLMGPFLDKNRAVVTTVHPIFGCSITF